VAKIILTAPFSLFSLRALEERRMESCCESHISRFSTVGNLWETVFLACITRIDRTKKKKI